MPAANWKKIETQYVGGEMSLRELAAKKKVSYSTLSKRASVGGWKEKREKYRAEMAEKALADARARGAAQLEKLMGAAGTLIDEAVAMLQDSEQFRRYVTTEGCGDGVSETSEKIFNKRDTRAMKDLASVLKDLAPLLSEHYGLQPKTEQNSVTVIMPGGVEELSG